MGMYQYIGEAWKKPKENMSELWKERLVSWRRQPSTVKIERPTRLDRARNLGYKAKPGYFVVRQRVVRGGRQRARPKKGRKPQNQRVKKILNVNYQAVAERKANARFLNCEVLNSYWVMQDGKYYWYEVIMVDRSHPSVKADKNIKWIANPANRKRAYRGLTSAARKSRGLGNKGQGTEKIRPSLRAQGRRH